MQVCKTLNDGSNPPLAYFNVYINNIIITMKKNKIPFYPQTFLICTDGSTIETNFLYSKNALYIKPDIKSNKLWLPEVENISLDSLSNKSSKFDKYEFDFKSLILKK